MGHTGSGGRRYCEKITLSVCRTHKTFGKGRSGGVSRSVRAKMILLLTLPLVLVQGVQEWKQQSSGTHKPRSQVCGRKGRCIGSRAFVLVNRWSLKTKKRPRRQVRVKCELSGGLEGQDGNNYCKFNVPSSPANMPLHDGEGEVYAD